MDARCMDNFSHSIVGIAMSHAGLNRFAARSWPASYSTWLLVLGANGPDIDVFASWGGNTARYLQVHRGYSHSFVGAPLIAITAAAILYLFHHRHKPRQPFHWVQAFAFALAGVLSHLLLDFITPYGTRLLLPFSHERLSWDIFPVLDLWLLPTILLAMLLPFLFQMISSEIGARRTSFRPASIFVLVFLVVLGGGRAISHRRALAMVDSFLYKGHEPIRASAYPDSGSPFLWHAVIDTGASYEEAEVNVLEEFDPTQTHSFYPAEPSPALEKAKETPGGRAFLDFAVYPYTYIERLEGGEIEVVFRDLRYEYGTLKLRKGAVLRVHLDEKLNVITERFQFRDPQPVR